MSEFVYIVGYDSDMYPIQGESNDFLAVWIEWHDLIEFFVNDPVATFEFIDNCWIAQLKVNDPSYFKSLHDDVEILAIMEAKRRGEDEHQATG